MAKVIIGPGLKVIRGRDWVQGDLDGNGLGTVVRESPYFPDVWEVKWDNGETGFHIMGICPRTGKKLCTLYAHQGSAHQGPAHQSPAHQGPPESPITTALNTVSNFLTASSAPGAGVLGSSNDQPGTMKQAFMSVKNKLSPQKTSNMYRVQPEPDRVLVRPLTGEDMAKKMRPGLKVIRAINDLDIGNSPGTVLYSDDDKNWWAVRWENTEEVSFHLMGTDTITGRKVYSLRFYHEKSGNTGQSGQGIDW